MSNFNNTRTDAIDEEASARLDYGFNNDLAISLPYLPGEPSFDLNVDSGSIKDTVAPFNEEARYLLTYYLYENIFLLPLYKYL